MPAGGGFTPQPIADWSANSPSSGFFSVWKGEILTEQVVSPNTDYRVIYETDQDYSKVFGDGGWDEVNRRFVIGEDGFYSIYAEIDFVASIWAYGSGWSGWSGISGISGLVPGVATIFTISRDRGLPFPQTKILRQLRRSIPAQYSYLYTDSFFATTDDYFEAGDVIYVEFRHMTSSSVIPANLGASFLIKKFQGYMYPPSE